MKPEMKFIERIFTDANIDAQLSEEDGIITITFVVGDVVNGLSYRRELCLYYMEVQLLIQGHIFFLVELEG